MKADLVTGATGFIGQHVAMRLLDLGRKVRVFCRRKSVSKLPPELLNSAEIVYGDLTDHASIDEAVQGAGRVFHCAGHVLDWGSREKFFSHNVRATEWLLEAAARAEVKRFIHVSSIAVFGIPAPAYFDDYSPYGLGFDLYSRSKIAADRLARRYHDERGVPVVVLRPAVVYGPGGSWLEEPLSMVRKNSMFLIGKGLGTCHSCYIENLVDAMMLAAEHPAAVGRAYIVADGEAVTFREYFNHVARIAGAGPVDRSVPVAAARVIASACEALARALRIEQRPILTHAAIDMITSRSRLSMDRIREELGFTPRYDLVSAMEELRRHYALHSYARAA